MSKAKPVAKQRSSDGLPLWLTITVILVCLALFAYVVLRFGPAGVPMATVIAGVLGAYGGLDRLVKQRKQEGDSS